MKRINDSVLFLLLCFMLGYCYGCKSKKMEDQTEFGWQLCITAPRGYSVEVYRGYLSTDSVLASSIINIGIESVGWTVDGTTCGGGSSIPTKLSLTYLSYVDKKFMKVEANLPAVTISTIDCNQQRIKTTNYIIIQT